MALMASTIRPAPPSRSRRDASAACGTPAASAPRSGTASPRSRNVETTRRDILSVATRELAEKGLAGARIDDIAARTRTSKRMIYYYFGSKEGLYVAALEAAYSSMRRAEESLAIDQLAPTLALEEMIGFVFDQHQGNPTFVRLVMNENLHGGRYIAQSTTIQAMNASILGLVKRTIERGKRSGMFRQDVDATDVFMSMSALCFYDVSNRYTFSTVFRQEMGSPAFLAKRRAQIVATLLAYVRAGAVASSAGITPFVPKRNSGDSRA
jgi:AcrR family transcriptional regulator